MSSSSMKAFLKSREKFVHVSIAYEPLVYNDGEKDIVYGIKPIHGGQYFNEETTKKRENELIESMIKNIQYHNPDKTEEEIRKEFMINYEKELQKNLEKLLSEAGYDGK